MRLTADDCSRVHAVRARRAILDVPSAHVPADASRGDIGEVCDVDTCGWPEPLVFVDFGRGAIACLASELEAA